MKKRLRADMPCLGFFICPVFTMILTELYTHNPFADMQLIPWILNLVFYWLTAAFLYLLTGRLRLALRIQTIFFLIAGLANYYVIAFRSSPILPWDIFSMGTAVTVADNFSYALPARIWLILLGFACLLLAEHIVSYKIQSKKLRLAGTLLSVILVMGFTFFLHQESVIAGMGLYDKMFTPGVVQKRNGCAIAFTMELKYLTVEKPDGYDAAESERLLADYAGNQTGNGAGADEVTGDAGGAKAADGKKLPNIIVIMDEAFADMAYIGDFTCNKDYMPFVHSLQGAEDTVTGRLHVSVLGGNTANTEFEFLTGNTMAFMPQGSIPYQQYIKNSIPSLASLLKQKGYVSVAMHPYYDTGWSRNTVYPWMGFDAMRFIEEYPDAEYVRKYVSDRSDFERIIQEYEQRDKEKPLFIFNVTMQNHGGYDQSYENLPAAVWAEGIESQPLTNYLSLISLTDQALSELISYFEAEEDDTIIVFFGDHQPNDTVAAPIWQQNGVAMEELSAEQDAARYQVPFLLWANFDIQEKQDVETSANFLALEVLKQAGIPLEGYYGYLEQLQERYPVISAKQILTADGSRLDEAGRKESEELLTYQRLQYYNLFDAD